MDEMILSSLCNYFNTLKNLGYVNLGLTSSLLIACVLNELIEDFAEYMNSEDLSLINEIMSCINSESCLIDYDNKDLQTVSCLDTGLHFTYSFPLEF